MELFKIYYSNGITTVVECDYFSEAEDIALTDGLEIVKSDFIQSSDDLNINIIKADSYNNGYLDGCKIMGKLRETHVPIEEVIGIIENNLAFRIGERKHLIKQIRNLIKPQ